MNGHCATPCGQNLKKPPLDSLSRTRRNYTFVAVDLINYVHGALTANRIDQSAIRQKHASTCIYVSREP